MKFQITILDYQDSVIAECNWRSCTLTGVVQGLAAGLILDPIPPEARSVLITFQDPLKEKG